MCLGIPGEIVEIKAGRDDLAVVDVVGVRRAVNIGLLGQDQVGVGDWVLVHVGFAMSKIDEAEAAATLTLLNGLGQAYTDELQALAESDIT
ncbi:HypC/HybG/HupF family hydrogenase formation chaperone [Micromonospora narathiwatensis]|uniref:Hydrogenase expression/formation protein HypC n=1 Tax=Micromonospora narathiwatensis TaxID=299146 RepID=A0A1A8ZG75_9ACTN|nr:HypC/HybG/HupF family hydrogenase formation chaperone [Micromonospora narathiwatensis]SBT43015.1 hydrogenase expression/formation protein HypC [Micromonospora narathiwatensis]